MSTGDRCLKSKGTSPEERTTPTTGSLPVLTRQHMMEIYRSIYDEGGHSLPPEQYYSDVYTYSTYIHPCGSAFPCTPLAPLRFNPGEDPQ